MKKFIAIFVIAGVIFACNEISKKPAKFAIYNTFCSSSSSDGPCSVIPIDVVENLGVGYESSLDSVKQPPFDVFSWQTFIALNWPADTAGNPKDNSISDSPNAPRVWEHYQDPAEIFGHSTPGLTLRLGVAKNGGQKFFYMDSKAPHPLLSGSSFDLDTLNGFKEADGHPLIDRNLNFVLYEIKMNPIETKFTINNKLTTVKGIYDLGIKNGNAISLPESDSATKKLGSMEIKASWRILIPANGDDTNRYYCRNATIFIDSAHTRNGKNLILTNVKVGLVGMHIIRKTAKLKLSETWSTFEHIDNTPDNPQEAQQSNKRWSFYNQECLNCVPNAIPHTLKGDHDKYIWEVTPPYAIKYAVQAPGQSLNLVFFGTQALRMYPIYKYTEMINQLWQAKLKGSVWANYRLVGTQWQTGEGHPQQIVPNFLGNTTLETYIQHNASCISCHSAASIKYNKTTIHTNLSYIFQTYARRDTDKKK